MPRPVGAWTSARRTPRWRRRRTPSCGSIRRPVGSGFFSCLGYIIGLVDVPDDEARDLLVELFAWQGRDEFVYRHSWEPDMLVMWDNRSVLHKATGGYDGHERLMHRTTIGAS